MIGILGGTFDPIHFGHLRAALEIAEHFGLSDMRLIPGKTPPHRPQPQASPQHRLAMLQAAITREPCLHADERELHREGYSYTVETLEHIRLENSEKTSLLLALGFDAFLHFQDWRRWRDILQLAHLVVIHRPGYALASEGWHEPFVTDDINDLKNAPAGRIYPLAVTALDISATDLRQRLREGKNPRYLLPDAVLDYIQRHKLYL